MKHETTRQLFRYWNGLRGSRLSPERNDIDPIEIRNLLIDTFILEIDAERRYPLRLVGDRTNSLFLRELKGRSFLSLWRGEDRTDVEFLLGCAVDAATPMIAGGLAAPTGRPGIELELLLLPLRHNGRTHARLLGCLSLRTIPSWIGLLPVDRMKLGPMRSIRPEECDADLDVEQDAFAVLHASPPVPARTRTRLTLIEGGISGPSGR